jgi:cytoskeletal protein RodZ
MASFGDELRRERELRGISLREVADATKISLRFLEALERNDFDCLHGGLYNRGIVRAYCEHIGVDAEAMVNAYLLEERSRSGRATRGEPPLLRRADTLVFDTDRPAAEHRPGTGRYWLLALILVALVACVVLYIRFSRADSEGPREPEPAASRPAGGRAGGARG